MNTLNEGVIILSGAQKNEIKFSNSNFNRFINVEPSSFAIEKNSSIKTIHPLQQKLFKIKEAPTRLATFGNDDFDQIDLTLFTQFSLTNFADDKFNYPADSAYYLDQSCEDRINQKLVKL